MTHVPISICGMTFFPENLNGQVTKDLLPRTSRSQKVSVLRTEEGSMQPKAVAASTEQLFPKGGRFLKLMTRFPFSRVRTQYSDIDGQLQCEAVDQN